jgi:hypothetical protein
VASDDFPWESVLGRSLSREGEDEQDASPEVVPLGFLDLERLFKLRLLVSIVDLAVVWRWRHSAAIVLLLLLLR